MTGSDENDLACTVRLDLLRALGVGKCVSEVERGGPGIGRADRLGEQRAVGFECGGGRGDSVGAHQHDSVLAGQRVEVGQRVALRAIHQGSLRRLHPHPRRRVEQDHVIGAVLVEDAQLGSGNRGQQQREAQQLQQQAQRLLDLAPVLEVAAHLRGHPEAQRRDLLANLGTVQQVQRGNPGRHNADQAQEFADAQIEKIHTASMLRETNLWKTRFGTTFFGKTRKFMRLADLSWTRQLVFTVCGDQSKPVRCSAIAKIPRIILSFLDVRGNPRKRSAVRR